MTAAVLRGGRGESPHTTINEKEQLIGSPAKPTTNTQLAQQPPSSTTNSSSNNNAGQSLFFFVILIAQSIGTQTYFKLSQRNGKYEYNTMSAMFIVELFKLCISLAQIRFSNGSLSGVITSFQGIKKQIYAAYIFLALSYAVYNQLIFYVMRLVDPGTFALFKSLMPGIVAALNLVAFGKRLTMAQFYCILIQIFGIIPVTASTNPET